MEVLGFRTAGLDDLARLGDWLLDRAMEHDRPSLLFVHELTRTAGRTEPPAPELELSLVCIERRTEPRAPEPAFALEAEHGKSKLRALACSPPAIVAVVLIVLIIVTGKVLIAWHDGAQREVPRRPDLGGCTEHVQHIERPEWTCTRDGP